MSGAASVIRDVAIVGAGAAGMMAAVSAATAGARTLLLDRRRKVGAKILISGGTRCNVTNVEVSEADFNTPSLPFVRNVLRQFTPEETRCFFERHGVALKLESTGKYFPVSDSARDVLAALEHARETSGAELRRETKVESVEPARDGFVLRTEQGSVAARAVVLCTGGLSYPQTGSDGLGYVIARALGHSIVETSPALTPLTTSGGEHAELAGVTLPATLTLWAGGRKGVSFTGSFLFTHGGYSGPAALNVSRHWIRRGWEALAVGGGVEVHASWVPGRTAEDLHVEWLGEAKRAPHRKAANLLAAWIPARLAKVVVERLGLDPDLALGRTTRDERQRLVAAVTDARLPVTGVMGYGKAEVTAGGVALDGVVARTLESRIRPGLFFAGEILDVDGHLGGFNFQWAWSSGWVAGRSAAGWATALPAPGRLLI
jgi:predicted Rossmann fold flavoprotein